MSKSRKRITRGENHPVPALYVESQDWEPEIEEEAYYPAEEQSIPRRISDEASQSKPGSVLATEAILVVLGIYALSCMMGIGLSAAADIKGGHLTEVWSLSALVRSIPLLVVLGALHFKGIYRMHGALAALGYSIIMVGASVFTGPERATLLGFITLPAVMEIKRGESPWSTLGYRLGPLVFGALLGMMPTRPGVPSWREAFGIDLGHILLPSTLSVNELTLWSVTAALASVGALWSVDRSSSDDETARSVSILGCLAVLLAIAGVHLQLGLHLSAGTVWTPIIGFMRVLSVSVAAVLLLSYVPRAHLSVFNGSFPILLGDNKTVLLGLLLMAALEVANCFGFLSRL